MVIAEDVGLHHSKQLKPAFIKLIKCLVLQISFCSSISLSVVLFYHYKSKKNNNYVFFVLKSKARERSFTANNIIKFYLVFESTFALPSFRARTSGVRNRSAGNEGEGSVEHLSGGNHFLRWERRLSCRTTGKYLPENARKFVWRRWSRKTITFVRISPLWKSLLRHQLEYYIVSKYSFLKVINNTVINYYD